MMLSRSITNLSGKSLVCPKSAQTYQKKINPFKHNGKKNIKRDYHQRLGSDKNYRSNEKEMELIRCQPYQIQDLNNFQLQSGFFKQFGLSTIGIFLIGLLGGSSVCEENGNAPTQELAEAYEWFAHYYEHPEPNLIIPMVEKLTNAKDFEDYFDYAALPVAAVVTMEILDRGSNSIPGMEEYLKPFKEIDYVPEVNILFDQIKGLTPIEEAEYEMARRHEQASHKFGLLAFASNLAEQLANNPDHLSSVSSDVKCSLALGIFYHDGTGEAMKYLISAFNYYYCEILEKYPHDQHQIQGWTTMFTSTFNPLITKHRGVKEYIKSMLSLVESKDPEIKDIQPLVLQSFARILKASK